MDFDHLQQIAHEYSRDISGLANEKDPCPDSVMARMISTLFTVVISIMIGLVPIYAQ